MRKLLPGVLIIFSVWVFSFLFFLILNIWTHSSIHLTPLETCTAFCDSSYGELVLIEGPDPLVCSCAIGEMEVDVE